MISSASQEANGWDIDVRFITLMKILRPQHSRRVLVSEERARGQHQMLNGNGAE
jgi:hypothetical protein